MCMAELVGGLLCSLDGGANPTGYSPSHPFLFSAYVVCRAVQDRASCLCIRMVPSRIDPPMGDCVWYFSLAALSPSWDSHLVRPAQSDLLLPCEASKRAPLPTLCVGYTKRIYTIAYIRAHSLTHLPTYPPTTICFFPKTTNTHIHLCSCLDLDN